MVICFLNIYFSLLLNFVVFPLGAIPLFEYIFFGKMCYQYILPLHDLFYSLWKLMKKF